MLFPFLRSIRTYLLLLVTIALLPTLGAMLCSGLCGTNLILLGISFGIALILAWFLGNFIIVRRIAKLGEALQRIEKGNLKTRTGLGDQKDELGVLGQAFDNMAQALEKKERQNKTTEALIVNVANEWRATFDAIPDPVMLLDDKLRIARVNQAAALFFGLPPIELSGSNCVNLVYGIDTPPKDCPYRKLEQTKRHVETELFLSPKNLWVNISLDPFFDDKGHLKGTVNIIRDITKRKTAELALRESENKFRDLAEKSAVGVFVIQDGLFRYANESCARMNGYTVDQLIDQKGPADLTHPDDLDFVFNVLEESMARDAGPKNFECRGITATKETIYIEIFATRTVYQQRGAIVGMVLDITDRKLAQKELQKERKRFRTLADYSPYGMMLQDSKGTVKYINPHFSALFGYELDDIPDGRAWFKKAYPDSEYRKKVISIWRKDFADLATIVKIPRIFTVTCKDGTTKEICFSPVRLNTGEILAVCEDITEKTRLEAQLLQARKMEAIGTLAGGIAHDFNNLLMGILGYTSLMLMKADPQDDQYDILKGIERQLKSGADLTKQLLGFARGGKYELKTIDINELLSQTADMFGRTRKEIRIEKQFDPDLYKVEADRSQIEQVLLNIFVNAGHAMPDGGNLKLESKNITFDEHLGTAHDLPAGQYMRMAIADNGVGMDPKTLERIFEPFFTTKKMGRGTGLGLASAYGIIKNHGGTIEVQSSIDQGTTFFIYIPATQKQSEPQKEVSNIVLKGAETILLVDDQENVREVSSEMLETLGYRVFTAENGNEAIRLFTEKNGQIDLVVLDMIMPGMSGSDTFDALRRIDPHIKVVLSSGYSLNGQATQILERGCNGFIQKPFSMEALSQKVREILD